MTDVQTLVQGCRGGPPGEPHLGVDRPPCRCSHRPCAALAMPSPLRTPGQPPQSLSPLLCFHASPQWRYCERLVWQAPALAGCNSTGWACPRNAHTGRCAKPVTGAQNTQRGFDPKTRSKLRSWCEEGKIWHGAPTRGLRRGWRPLHSDQPEGVEMWMCSLVEGRLSS